MRLLIFILLFSSVAQAQPVGYVEGTQVCWSFNGRGHGYFRASGWNAATDHVLIFFGGDGQTNCGNYDGMQPGLFLRDGSGGSNWNGVTNLPADVGGGSRKWLVFIMTNHGNQPDVYAADITAFLNTIGVTIDAEFGKRIHYGGGSGGPGRANSFFNYSTSNPYRTFHSTGIWMSTTLYTVSANTPDKNYCWYGDADENGGTPPSFTINVYNQIAGEPNVDKFLGVTVGGTHSNTTWGDCFNISGTEYDDNRWIWMIVEGEELIIDPIYPQDHLISVNGSMVYDITGAAHKPDQLFDGDLNTLVFENNLNGYILDQSGGQVAWIVLDSFYTHPKVAAYKRNLNGGGGTVQFSFHYDWTDTARRSPTYTATLADGVWRFADSVNSRGYEDSFRLVLMRIPSGASDKFSEVRIFGVNSGAAASIYPTSTTAPPDPGKFYMGYNKVHTDKNLDDAAYSQRANTDHDYIDTNVYTFNGGFRYVFNRFANSITASYIPVRDSGRTIFPYLAGPRLKFKYPNLSNDSKDIPIGSDSTNIENWVYTYRSYYALAAKLGNNPSVDMSAYTFNSTTPGYGLGLISEIEGLNEGMGRWKGLGFHNPRVLILNWKQTYNGAKAADPNINVISGALTGLDSSFFKALYISNLIRFQTKTMPLDVVAANEYATNAGGQHQGVTQGISPERFRLLEKGTAFISVVRKHVPGAPVYLTEFGWDTHDGSSYRVPTISGQTAEETKANFSLRALDQGAGAGFSRYFHYTHKTIGGGDFGTTGISVDIFIQQAPKDTLPSYMQFVLTEGQWNGTNQWLTIPLPLYWYMTCRAYLFANYKAWPVVQVNGDTSGLWRHKYDHLSDPNKKVYSLAMGTDDNSSVSNYQFTVTDAVSAKMYTPTIGNRFGVQTNLSVVDGVITVPEVSEKTRYIEVTISDEEPDNQAPVALAGNNILKTLPTNQIDLDGSSSTDPDGTISTYLWTKISGPSTFNIVSPNTAETSVTSLVEGTYVFRLTVTDNDGAVSTDDVQVIVAPEPVIPPRRGRFFRGSLKNRFRNL